MRLLALGRLDAKAHVAFPHAGAAAVPWHGMVSEQASDIKGVADYIGFMSCLPFHRLFGLRLQQLPLQWLI